MENHRQHRFERGVLKFVCLIGVVRFVIALINDDVSTDGLADFYLDIFSLAVFAAGLTVVLLKSSTRWVVGLFYIPLVIILWASFYFHNGLVSSTEINAFAMVVIFSLTLQGRFPLVFVIVFLLGLFVVLYIVESKNLNYLPPTAYNTSTFNLMFVSLATIGMVFYAKNTFRSRHNELIASNQLLVEKRNEIQRQNQQLKEQNERLDELRAELEVKVQERANRLHEQKESIEEYMKLTLTELTKPYEKSLEAIRNIDNSSNDQLIAMIIDSGEKLKVEVENLRSKLLSKDA